jgi:phage terminase small subunit
MSKELARRHDLTDKEAIFVQHISEGISPPDAARLAGFAKTSRNGAAYSLLRAPNVLAAIHNEVRRKLVAGAPIALAVIERLVKDETTPPKIRLDAAKTLLDRAGHIAPRAIVDKATHELALHELSIGELRQLADRLEGELAGRAKDVSGANAAPAETQAVEVNGSHV